MGVNTVEKVQAVQTLTPSQLKKAEYDQFLKLFFEGREFQREENVAAMRHLAVIHATTGLELGQRLLVHKHSLEFGDFENDLGRIGIELRSAQRYMFVAKRFGPIAKGQVAGLSLRKMLTIAEELTPEQIQAVSDKKKLTDRDLGKNADELRDNLRSLRKKLEDQAALGLTLQEQLDQVRAERQKGEEDLSRLERLTARAVAAMRELRDYVARGAPARELTTEGPEAMERIENMFGELSVTLEEKGVMSEQVRETAKE